MSKAQVASLISSSSCVVTAGEDSVLSSSFKDCNSSLPVSSSSEAERSSSFMACNSSLEAFSSSVDVSCSSTMARSWSRVCLSCSSTLCKMALVSSLLVAVLFAGAGMSLLDLFKHNQGEAG